MAYRVLLAPPAERMLRDIGKRRGKQALRQIAGVFERLREAPLDHGKPLRGPLAGYRSDRAGRFRVIYRVEAEKVTVLVVAVGWREDGSREDIYEIAKRVIERDKEP